MDTNTTDRSENPAAPGVGSGALLALLDELSKAEYNQTLRGNLMGTAREFGLKFPKQHLPLMCAERGLMLLLNRRTFDFIILRRDQWEDQSR